MNRSSEAPAIQALPPLYRDCAVCDGTGTMDMEHPLCVHCGTRYHWAEIEIADGADKLPCGHSWAKLVEVETCSECEGLKAEPTEAGRQILDLLWKFPGTILHHARKVAQ